MNELLQHFKNNRGHEPRVTKQPRRTKIVGKRANSVALSAKSLFIPAKHQDAFNQSFAVEGL